MTRTKTNRRSLIKRDSARGFLPTRAVRATNAMVFAARVLRAHKHMSPLSEPQEQS